MRRAVGCRLRRLRVLSTSSRGRLRWRVPRLPERLGRRRSGSWPRRVRGRLSLRPRRFRSWLSSTSRIRCCRAMSAARSRAISMSPSTSSNLASSARMRASLAAGANRDATTVTSRSRIRPDQARAWPRLPALAHTRAREPLSARRLATTSAPRALKLRTGFAVSSLILTLQPRLLSRASHRYNGVSRKIGLIMPRAAWTRAVSRRVDPTTTAYRRTVRDQPRWHGPGYC